MFAFSSVRNWQQVQVDVIADRALRSLRACVSWLLANLRLRSLRLSHIVGNSREAAHEPIRPGGEEWLWPVARHELAAAGDLLFGVSPSNEWTSGTRSDKMPPRPPVRGRALELDSPKLSA